MATVCCVQAIRDVAKSGQFRGQFLWDKYVQRSSKGCTISKLSSVHFQHCCSIVEEPKRKPHPLPRISPVIAGDAPIATEWSVEEVSQYFHELGFIIEAPTFREQVRVVPSILYWMFGVPQGSILGPALWLRRYIWPVISCVLFLLLLLDVVVVV